LCLPNATLIREAYIPHTYIVVVATKGRSLTLIHQCIGRLQCRCQINAGDFPRRMYLSHHCDRWYWS
jgi:hypothetical protein